MKLYKTIFIYSCTRDVSLVLFASKISRSFINVLWTCWWIANAALVLV